MKQINCVQSYFCHKGLISIPSVHLYNVYIIIHILVRTVVYDKLSLSLYHTIHQSKQVVINVICCKTKLGILAYFEIGESKYLHNILCG